MLSLLLTMATPQAAQAVVPEPKSPVVKYCEDHQGDKIGDGECSSLVTEALRAAGMSGYQNEDKPAKGDYVWGDFVYEVDTRSGHIQETPDWQARLKVKPGDVIQFRDVRMLYHADGMTYRELLDHHSAIIASVSEKGLKWKIYHQNAANKRYVTAEDMDLRTMSAGYLLVYRPVKADKS